MLRFACGQGGAEAGVKRDKPRESRPAVLGNKSSSEGDKVLAAGLDGSGPGL